jgi:hypothetical protein
MAKPVIHKSARRNALAGLKKLEKLLANIVIFANVAILTQAMNELVSEGLEEVSEAVSAD